LLAGIAVGALLTAPASAQVSTQYEYDALGRVTAAVDSNGKAVGYAYDSAGNRVQVSSTVPLDELIPTAFTANGTPNNGLVTPNGMRDGAFAPAASMYGTNAAANNWVTANLGAAKLIDHVDLAPTAVLPWTVAATNGIEVQWSTDNVTWTTVATTAGAVANQYMTIPMGGVTAQYIRLLQPSPTQMAFGDFRIYGHNNAINHPPVADSFGVTLPAAGGIIDLTGHIHDADNDALTISGFNNPTAAADGSVTQASNTSFSYVPTTGFQGPDSFSYKITDGHNSPVAGLISVTVSAPLDRPPVANPEPIGTPPGVTATVNVLANDTDPDGDPLTITSATGTHLGYVTISGPNLIYTPIAGQSGTDSVTYTISDGRGGTSSATDPITIAFGAGPDHAPTMNFNDTSITENTTLSHWAIGANNTDVDGDTLTISGVTSPTANRGTVTIDPGGTTITYVPFTGFVGTDVINYTVSDGRDFTAVPGTGDVVVNQIANQPPHAGSTTISTLAGQATSLNVLSISSDPEGQAIHVTATTNGQNGTTTFNTSTVFYQPLNHFVGTDSFTYTIVDIYGAPSTGTITVTSVNQPPTAFPISEAVANGGTVMFGAPQNDPEGQTVTFVSFGSPSRGSIALAPGGATATYTSTAGLAGGTDTFSYTIQDSLGATNSGTVSIQVSPPTQISVQPTVTSYDAVLNTHGGSSFPPAVGLVITNGSGSYTYSWTMVPGSGGGIVPTSPAGATTQFTASSQASTNTYTAEFICTVTDTVTGHTGVSSPVSVSVDVETGS
jgi:YD repeat-containing protein